MILVNAIVEGSGVEATMHPERELTAEERATVIYTEIYDEQYHYFQEEDRAIAESRINARRKLDEDRASKFYGSNTNNPNYATNVALYSSLLAQYPDDQMEALRIYMETKHPDIEIIE